jgi:putative ABC transport system permease protein
VAIIDQAFADRAWPNQNPVGQKLEISNEEKDNSATVVGVVPTLKAYGYAKEPTLPQAYLATRQTTQNEIMLLVRADRAATALTRAMRQAITEIDPNQPAWDVQTMEHRIDATFATPRLYTFLLATFAGLALLLAAIGLYGVLAFQVTRRTREFGIRLALGALHSQVIAMVLRRGVALLAIGVAIGLLGALALGRLLGSLLYQTSSFDTAVVGTVTLALAVVAMFACWLPARRVSKVNPLIALRAE